MEYTNLENLLIKIGEEISKTYKDKLKAGAYVTGKLYNSVKYKIEYGEDSVRLIFLAEDYWINIEKGRKAGSKMPPVNEIKKWIIARGIPYKPGLDYKIARSIAKKGIKARPYMKDTVNQLNNKYDKSIAEALSKDIELSLKETINK
jgi:hypothetical protein